MAARPRDRSQSFVRFYLLAWVPPAVLAFHLKYVLLNANGGGFEFVAQVRHLPSAADLSLWQRVALFREDALIAGALAPLLLLVALRYLTPLARGLLMGAVSGATLAILFVELKCFWEVGTFLPLSVLWGGLTDAGRDYLRDYLPAASLIKLIVLVLTALGTTWAVTRLEIRSPRGATTGQVSRLFPRTALLTVPLAAAVLWMPSVPSTPYKASAVLAAIRSFIVVSHEDAIRRQYALAQPEALRAEYRSLTHAPIPNQPGRYWARAAGHDVIFFVLETAPAQCLDIEATPE